MTDMTLEQVIGAMTRILESTGNVGIRIDRAKISKWSDAINAHLAKAAQPAAVGDNWPYGVGIYGPANMPAPQSLDAAEVTDDMVHIALTKYHGIASPVTQSAAMRAALTVVLAHPRPTSEQAGKVVAWRYRSPAQVEFSRPPSLTDDAELVRLVREAGGHEIVDLSPAHPRAVGVPDEEIKASVIDFLHDVNHLPLIAAAELLVARLKSLANAPDGEVG